MKTAFWLTAMMSSQSCSGNSVNGWRRWMPALLIDQMPAGVPTGVQAALRFIDLHRNRPERQRRGGKVQHGIPLLLHPQHGDAA